MADQTTPKPVKRRKPESERLVQRAVRMTPAQWAKVDACGGMWWVRQLVDKARPPKA